MLLELILKALVVVLALSLVFGVLFRTWIDQRIFQMGKEQIGETLDMQLREINKVTAKSAPESRMQEIRARLTMFQVFDVTFDDPLFPAKGSSGMVQIVPLYSPDCHSTSVLLDDQDNILVTNRQALLTYVKFGKEDTDSGYFVCDKVDLGMPAVDQLFADYEKMAEQENDMHYIRTQLTSVYLDRATHTFIPHEGVMQLIEEADSDSPLHEETELASQPIHITIPGDRYELVELHTLNSKIYPYNALTAFMGEKQDTFDRFQEFEPFRSVSDTTNAGGFSGLEDNIYAFFERSSVYIDDKLYTLQLGFMLDSHDPQIQRYFWKYTLLCAGILSFLAALWVWRRHTLNQARYAFEDYQRDLTNHLAHDIKTPLMAIGGYAENLRDCDMTQEEQHRYLGAILENVTFTDSIINRTLQLGSMEQQKLRKEPVDLAKLTGETFRKYAPLLEEKHITWSVQGDTVITTDWSGLEIIVENLVSNAVKYTPEGGTIEAALSPKRIMLENTVTEQVSTKELKTPFVRGDAARSNSQGTGLGLTLAEHAAQANAGKLTLSCTETKFRAEVKF
ncbi:MAG: hypothetical protein IKN55_01005 [Oscillospiraceae bacterium]|nr:hypothetical protein [Oscillospiraceae bacterium]